MTPATTDPQPTERRRYARRSVEGVHGSFLLAADATVVNMSLTGLALETPTYLHVGRDYQVKIRFEHRTLDLAGKVIWCTLIKTERRGGGEVAPIYRAGVRFQSMLTDEGEQLAGLLQSSSDARLAERITGRIRMQGGESSELEVIVPFSVIELSLSGMRISTRVRLEVQAEHRLELQFGESQFAVEARVVRCDGDPLDETPVVAGIEFLDVTPDKLRDLETLIEQQVVEF